MHCFLNLWKALREHTPRTADARNIRDNRSFSVSKLYGRSRSRSTPAIREGCGEVETGNGAKEEIEL
jgi:hypothetical protein